MSKTEEKSKWKIIEKIGNRVNSAFKVPKRKAFIDSDLEFISKEDSKIRINKLLIFIIFFLHLILIGLIIAFQEIAKFKEPMNSYYYSKFEKYS